MPLLNRSFIADLFSELKNIRQSICKTSTITLRILFQNTIKF